MVKAKLHHVGIVCTHNMFVDQHRTLCDIFGSIVPVDAFYVKEFKCMCYMVEGGVEYIIPKEGDNPLNNWLQSQENNTGIHHYAVQVDDIHEICQRLKDNGVPLVSDKPVVGVGGILVNFIHPDYDGTLIELVQDDR